jgi:N-acetyl sugar amidotransferase
MDIRENKICSKGVWDLTVPDIDFNPEGISNYARFQERMMSLYPRGTKGEEEWNGWIGRIRKGGRGKPYDCIIGVSGGTDSSYLLYLAKSYGLRPLAVYLDNGWGTDVSVKNIKKMTSKLGIDLETYVIDYEEVKCVLRSYMRASLPWVDYPTDLAIKAILYRIAVREKLKFILTGEDFRTEGIQPMSWTNGDARQLRYITKRFGNISLKSFPYINPFHQLFNGIFLNIQVIRPYYFLDYQKKKAQQYLSEHFEWEYYGGHHHENLFTRFVVSYWLPRKFNIDKRIITLSAQVLSGEITREHALETLHTPPYDPAEIERDKDLVIKKLDIDQAEFGEIMKRPNKLYTDYPSYFPIFRTFGRLSTFLFRYIFSFRPMSFEISDFIKHKK